MVYFANDSGTLLRQTLGPLLAYRRQALYSFCDDDPSFPGTDRAPTNGRARRISPSENRFPLGDEIPLGVLHLRGRVKGLNRGQTHLEQRVEGFQHLRHALERGASSVRLFRPQPEHEVFTVEPFKQQREKSLQIEIPSQKILSAQIHQRLIEFRLARLRAQPCRAEADKLGTSPLLDLFNMFVKSSYADFCNRAIVCVVSCTLLN